MSKRLAKEQLYVIIGVIVLVSILIAAVSTVLWLKQREKTATDTTPSNTATLSKEELEQKRLAKQIEDARAREVLSLVSGEADKQKKADYFTELALLQLNRGNYDEALTFASEAETLVKSYKTAGLLGDIYFAMKDYDRAAKQYGVAMDRSEKASTGSRSAYNEYAVLKKKAEDAQ